MPPPSLQRLWRRDPPEGQVIVDEEDVRNAERLRAALTVLGVLAVLGVLISYGTLGRTGLIASLTVVAVSILLGAAVGVPGGPPPRRRRRRTPLSFDEPYPTFRQVSEALSWAEVSPRHYDMVTRPLLVRLMASRLSERHGVDVHRSPGAARALVGEDLWWWLDPERPAEGSSQPPGVDVRTLTRLVDRLETL